VEFYGRIRVRGPRIEMLRKALNAEIAREPMRLRE